MARPQKKRFICCLPQHACFLPQGANTAPEVLLTIDEYETLRLIDLEGSTQEECARQMQVGRTTIQGIYNDARRKVADALVNGKCLRITGGDYQLCDSYERTCGHGCGRRCRKANTPMAVSQQRKEGTNIMKIAVTYDNGEIFQHFGHTEAFKIYEVTDGTVTASTVVDTNGSGHGALAGFLTAYGVDTLICGGIGAGAQNALASMGIRLYGGCSGSADEAVAALLAGTLTYNPDVHCNHHDHEHGEGHTCGDHGCGGHHHEDGGHCCH